MPKHMTWRSGPLLCMVGYSNSCYCIFHVTLPNRVLCFISSGNFKLPFLCEFFMDCPEMGIGGSLICILGSCNKSLPKIYLLQFHVFGSVGVKF